MVAERSTVNGPTKHSLCYIIVLCACTCIFHVHPMRCVAAFAHPQCGMLVWKHARCVALWNSNAMKAALLHVLMNEGLMEQPTAVRYSYIYVSINICIQVCDLQQRVDSPMICDVTDEDSLIICCRAV
jgi:hypothetical protein